MLQTVTVTRGRASGQAFPGSAGSAWEREKKMLASSPSPPLPLFPVPCSLFPVLQTLLRENNFKFRSFSRSRSRGDRPTMLLDNGVAHK